MEQQQWAAPSPCCTLTWPERLQVLEGGESLNQPPSKCSDMYIVSITAFNMRPDLFTESLDSFCRKCAHINTASVCSLLAAAVACTAIVKTVSALRRWRDSAAPAVTIILSAQTQAAAVLGKKKTHGYIFWLVVFSKDKVAQRIVKPFWLNSKRHTFINEVQCLHVHVVRSLISLWIKRGFNLKKSL